MATITTIQSGDSITNSRTDINNNFQNLNNSKIETSVIDTDTTLSANSDDKIPSQKAVKAYVDAGGDPNGPAGYVSTSSGVSDSGKGVKLNATGILDGSFIPQLLFGNGSDGDVTISSGTTTLTKDMYYNNLTVNGTGILKTAGFRVFVKGTLTVDGTSGAMIENKGGNGGNANGATGGSAGAASGSGFFAGGAIGVVGATGRTTTGEGGGGNTGTASGAYALNTTAGSAGGAGGAGSEVGGSGGAGGAVTSSSITKPFAITNIPCVEITGTTTLTLTRQNVAASGGSGGAGGLTESGGDASSGGGGGSGGSGGVVFVFAFKTNLTGASCINANGGNGGNGGDGIHITASTWAAGGGGGGAGGNGGVVIFGYYQKTGTGTVTANGGSGGAGGTKTDGGGFVGAGVNGSAGNSGANGLVITFNTSA